MTAKTKNTNDCPVEVKKMKTTCLIQRLQKPFAVTPKGLLGQLTAFGGGIDLSKKAFKLMEKSFRLDYMGAAEFESGALPRAFRAMATVASEKRLVQGKVMLKIVGLPFVEKPVYYICETGAEQYVENLIQILAEDDYPRKPRLQEGTGFRAALGVPKTFGYNAVGWFEIDNGFMFFVDKLMYQRVSFMFGLINYPPKGCTKDKNWAEEVKTIANSADKQKKGKSNMKAKTNNQRESLIVQRAKAEIEQDLTAATVAEQQRLMNKANLKPMSPEKIYEFRRNYARVIVERSLEKALDSILFDDGSDREYYLMKAKTCASLYNYNMKIVERRVIEIRRLATDIYQAKINAQNLDSAYNNAKSAVTDSALKIQGRYNLEYNLKEKVAEVLQDIFIKKAKLVLAQLESYVEEEIDGILLTEDPYSEDVPGKFEELVKMLRTAKESADLSGEPRLYHKAGNLLDDLAWDFIEVAKDSRFEHNKANLLEKTATDIAHIYGSRLSRKIEQAISTNHAAGFVPGDSLLVPSIS